MPTKLHLIQYCQVELRLKKKKKNLSNVFISTILSGRIPDEPKEWTCADFQQLGRYKAIIIRSFCASADKVETKTQHYVLLSGPPPKTSVLWSRVCVTVGRSADFLPKRQQMKRHYSTSSWLMAWNDCCFCEVTIWFEIVWKQFTWGFGRWLTEEETELGAECDTSFTYK